MTRAWTRGYRKADGTTVRGYASRRHTPSAADQLRGAPPTARPTDGWDVSIDRVAYATAGERTPREIDALISGGNPEACSALAGRSDLERGQQIYLADHPERSVREALAGNCSIPPDLVEQLAYDADGEVRVAALGNDHCPTSVLVAAAREDAQCVSSPEIVRVAAISDPRLPEYAIREAATSPDPLYRSAAGENPAAPADVLTQLSLDPDRDVRAVVARTTRTEPGTLHGMVGDPDDEVAARSATTLLVLSRR